jgi:hypothetical protein
MPTDNPVSPTDMKAVEELIRVATDEEYRIHYFWSQESIVRLLDKALPALRRLRPTTEQIREALERLAKRAKDDFCGDCCDYVGNSNHCDVVCKVIHDLSDSQMDALVNILTAELAPGEPRFAADLPEPENEQQRRMEGFAPRFTVDEVVAMIEPYIQGLGEDMEYGYIYTQKDNIVDGIRTILKGE